MNKWTQHLGLLFVFFMVCAGEGLVEHIYHQLGM